MGPFGDIFFFGGGYGVGIGFMDGFETGFCFFGVLFFFLNVWKKWGEILVEIQFGAWKKNDFNSLRMGRMKGTTPLLVVHS